MSTIIHGYENWERFTGVAQADIDKETFDNNPMVLSVQRYYNGEQ